MSSVRRISRYAFGMVHHLPHRPGRTFFVSPIQAVAPSVVCLPARARPRKIILVSM